MQEQFTKKYSVAMKREEEKEVSVPFVFVSKAEMADAPYLMSPNLD